MNRAILLLAGAVEIMVGLGLLFFPRLFYASYGLTLGPAPSLLSEIRAPGAVLAALGVVLVRGAFFPVHRARAAWLGSVVYLSYAAARVVSIFVDGIPHANLLVAGAAELGLGAACSWVYFQTRKV